MNGVQEFIRKDREACNFVDLSRVYRCLVARRQRMKEMIEDTLTMMPSGREIRSCGGPLEVVELGAGSAEDTQCRPHHDRSDVALGELPVTERQVQGSLLHLRRPPIGYSVVP